MMKHFLFAILTGLLVTSCTLPAYIVREYTYLPEGLNKKGFRKAVADKNAEIRSEDGYVKLYDLVPIDRSIRRKLYLEEWLFSDSYALPRDSSLIRANLIRLSSIKDRDWVWPSVYPQMYGNSLNPNYWTAWMDKTKQQAIRDSIDMATTPILKASRFKLDPKFYSIYKQAMRIKKFNAKKTR
jgi:hypothetical protein